MHLSRAWWVSSLQWGALAWLKRALAHHLDSKRVALAYGWLKNVQWGTRNQTLALQRVDFWPSKWHSGFERAIDWAWGDRLAVKERKRPAEMWNVDRKYLKWEGKYSERQPYELNTQARGLQEHYCQVASGEGRHTKGFRFEAKLLIKTL